MESLISDFIQFFMLFRIFFFLEGRVGTTLCLCTTLKFYSYVVRQLARQLLNSTSGHNNLAQFHFWLKETMLKQN